MRVQQRDLDRALERLQAASDRISLPRRWSLESGSGTMGIQYRLSNWHPYFGTQTKEIGRTRAAALGYMVALADAMDLIWTVLKQREVPSLGGEDWLQIQPEPSELPQGLCSDRSDHQPHRHHSTSLGRFWCTADQSQRQPFASQARLRAVGTTHGPDESPEEGGVRMRP